MLQSSFVFGFPVAAPFRLGLYPLNWRERTKLEAKANEYSKIAEIEFLALFALACDIKGERDNINVNYSKL